MVPDIPDAEMIRMYANENATQRGNSGTAIAGSVASAVRYLAKALLLGSDKFVGTPHERATALGNLTSEKGLGVDLVLRFLEDIPGVNVATVRQQLANLKASGDYDEIIEAVRNEIEEENKEALKALERAEKERLAAEQAAQLAEERQKEAEERSQRNCGHHEGFRHGSVNYRQWAS